MFRVGALGGAAPARQSRGGSRPRRAITIDGHRGDEAIGRAAVQHRSDIRLGQPAQAATRSDPDAAVAVFAECAHFVTQEPFAPGQVLDPIGMHAGDIALNAHEAGAARADPQGSAPVNQQRPSGRGSARRFGIGGARTADAAKCFERIADPDRARPIFRNVAVAAGVDQREGTVAGSAAVQPRRRPRPEPALRITPQPQHRLVRQSLALADQPPAFAVEPRQAAMARDPNRTVRILDDRVHVALAHTIFRGVLLSGAPDDLRDTADRAEPDPQAPVARRENRRDAVVRQRLVPLPLHELGSVESHQALSRAQPQIPLLILRNGVDAKRKGTLFFGPVRQRVVRQGGSGRNGRLSGFTRRGNGRTAGRNREAGKQNRRENDLDQGHRTILSLNALSAIRRPVRPWSPARHPCR